MSSWRTRNNVISKLVNLILILLVLSILSAVAGGILSIPVMISISMIFVGVFLFLGLLGCMLGILNTYTA